MTTIIDINLALEQAAGNEELAKELFAMLLQELPVLSTKLRQAITRGDHIAMWEQAHKLYGSTAYCGVPWLRQASKAMEDAIKTADVQRIQRSYATLDQQIKQLIQEGPSWMGRTWQNAT
ncbi:MAG: Hpt domain-containing protein [Gammaproteobacteria bacterium]|nr:Hpt domain-containing protein [Gammaproteobacteria bacterium]